MRLAQLYFVLSCAPLPGFGAAAFVSLTSQTNCFLMFLGFVRLLGFEMGNIQ